MANKKISQLIAKGSALAATDLVEIAEDSGGGIYVTKSVTGANIKSGLQDTLVSGTNIKTINGSSVLGSGDLVIGGGGGTGLQSAVYSSLFGLYTSNSLTAAATQNHNIPSAGMNYVPYIPNTTFTCVEFGIRVVYGQATGLGRICVYSSSNNMPTNLLYSSTDLDCSTGGITSAISSFTFTAGTTYWLGIQTNVANITVTGLSGGACIPLAYFNTGSSIICWFQGGLT